jgi:imidazolonepropionase-like amidohydrolase
MILRTTAALLLLLATAVAHAADAKLAEPPADAETWVIVSAAGQHGQSARWTTTDGVRWSRETMSLRGFKTDVEQQQRFAPDGALVRFEVRGRTPQGDATELFAVANGKYRFKSPIDQGRGTARAGLLYSSFGGTFDSTIALLDQALRAPNRAADLLPSGRLSVEPLTTADVSKDGTTRKLTAYAVTGFGFSPTPVWYDGDRFFGQVDVISILPKGWESAAQVLSKAQEDALGAHAPALLARIAKRPQGAVAFRNVQIYDADAQRFRRNMTVVVSDGRIAAVGPAVTTQIPAAAEIIQGSGRTLVPGLWDNHLHFGDDSTGPLLLAQGITSVRDPGNRPEELLARKRRIDEGKLLGPRIIPSLIVDGPGERSAQGAVLVKDEQDAIAAARRAKRDGFFGIKLYGSLDPKLVKPIADEAHKLGLRVHGHIPAGMRPLDAVRAGYDEITHIYFVMMQAMPDAVVAESNGEQRLFGPARHAAGVDLTKGPMKDFLDELQKRGTAIDPTLPVVENIVLGQRGRLSPAYQPFAGVLPPQVERGFKAGGLVPPADLKRATMLKSFAKFQALVLDLKRRGMPVLAGTDGLGLELVRELELYVQAGMTPAEALASATIVPARTFGLARDTGSIAIGKLAELALINGDPSTRIGDLRQVELVVQGDRLMRAQDLRAAIGIAAPPRKGLKTGFE